MRFQRTGFQKAIGLVLALVMVFSLIPTMEAQAGSYDEEMANAVKIEYGENYSQTGVGGDWFCFKTKKYAAVYTVQVLNPNGDSASRVDYKIYNTDSSLPVVSRVNWSVSESGNTYSFKLSANENYYINFNYYNYEYVFNITYKKEEADDSDSAKEIDFNTEYTKTIDTRDDVDWFKIVTPEYETTYSLQVTNQSEAYADFLAYSVCDDEKNWLYKISYYEKSQGATKTLALDAGKTYYIVFYNCNSYSSGGFKYTFKLTKSDTDSLDAPVVSKVSAVSKGFKVTWKRDTDATGYQIRYSTKKNMKNAKTVTVSSTSKKITKLKAKTKYYVQVRAYAKQSTGKKLYSKWSTKSTVTTKK